MFLRNLLVNNQTTEDTEKNIQQKPQTIFGIIESEAQITTSTGKCGERMRKLTKTGHSEKIKIVEDYFVSPVVITVKSD